MSACSVKLSAPRLSTPQRHKLTNRRWSVLIADDYIMIAEGLQRLIEQEFPNTAIVHNSQDLLKAVAISKPDMVILDIRMPILNGIEATRRIRKISPATKILTLTLYHELEYVVEAIQAGASGYVLKSCTVSELLVAIRRVLNDDLYLDPSIDEHQVITRLNQQVEHIRLSPRQREVLQLVAEGHTAKQIANVLNLSVKTAVFHKTGLKERLGLHTTAELTRYALEHGIISSTPQQTPVPRREVQRDQGSALAQSAG